MLAKQFQSVKIIAILSIFGLGYYKTLFIVPIVIFFFSPTEDILLDKEHVEASFMSTNRKMKKAIIHLRDKVSLCVTLLYF